MFQLFGKYRDMALAVKNPCHLNIAACLIKLKRYDEAIAQCGIVRGKFGLISVNSVFLECHGTFLFKLHRPLRNETFHDEIWECLKVTFFSSSSIPMYENFL